MDFIEKIENAKKKLEEELNENAIKLRSFAELQSQLEMSKNQAIIAEKNKIETSNNFANKLKEISHSVQTLEKQNKELLQEKVTVFLINF